jgi:hypothetical protein
MTITQSAMLATLADTGRLRVSATNIPQGMTVRTERATHTSIPGRSVRLDQNTRTVEIKDRGHMIVVRLTDTEGKVNTVRSSIGVAFQWVPQVLKRATSTESIARRQESRGRKTW